MEIIFIRSGKLVVKTSVRMTEEMQKALREVSSALYGAKGKSRWVRDALSMLAAEDPAMTSVGFGEAHFVPTCSEQILLSDGSEEILENLVARVRRQDPLAEGVKSQVLRAAVRWRLERSSRPFALNRL